jgi:predicted amidophosphoribosyltransferase
MADDVPSVFVLACVACGKTVSGSEATCPRCGASFEDLCFECPFCGSIVSAGATKCSECNTEFSIFAEAVDDAASVELDGPFEEAVQPSEPAAAEPQAALPEPVAEPELPAPVAETNEYECPACGKPVGEKDDACPHCGARFTE